MLSYVENEKGGGGQQSCGDVVLDERMLLEEPSKSHATAAGGQKESCERVVKDMDTAASELSTTMRLKIVYDLTSDVITIHNMKSG